MAKPTNHQVFSLEGQTVLITGGNKGIGKGIAEAMALSGANVAIVCRNEKSALETIAQLEPTEKGHRFYAGDVTRREDVERVVNEIVKDYGRIDILVNNAGIATPFDAMNDDDLDGWYHMIDVDLNGAFLMCHFVGRVMKRQNYGRIINITSNSARIVNIPQKSSSYNAAKAAADQMTKCLAYEWAQYGIRVNSIAPGYTETDLVTCVKDENETKGWKDYWLRSTPTGRFNKPIELGWLAVYLASEVASQITGSVITMDGGYMLAR